MSTCEHEYEKWKSLCIRIREYFCCIRVCVYACMHVINRENYVCLQFAYWLHCRCIVVVVVLVMTATFHMKFIVYVACREQQPKNIFENLLRNHNACWHYKYYFFTINKGMYVYYIIYNGDWILLLILVLVLAFCMKFFFIFHFAT